MLIALVNAHNAAVIIFTIALGFIILVICSGISKRREARRSNFNAQGLNNRPVSKYEASKKAHQ